MKKLVGVTALMFLVIQVPAYAQSEYKEDKYALGNLYTKALNVLESSGMLDTIEPKNHVQIKDIHANHGQVLITIESDTGPKTITYDLFTQKLIY